MSNTSDPYYPTVDFDFLEEQILKSNKVISNSKIHIGSTIAFVKIGSQALHKRYISMRELSPNEICYEQATGIAINLGFIIPLMEWLEKNRNWKEGGYYVPQ